jgi:dTDP-4-dehydrorhamnose reductase
VKTNKLILGDGLLGSELVKQTGWDYISRKKDMMDLDDIVYFIKDVERYDEIINCIAHTDTYDENKDKHWNVNYKFVTDLVDACADKKLIHISTDYIYTNSRTEASEEDVPVHCRNWYGYTKLLADGHVQLKSNNFLLLRETHKKEPFPHDKAWINQIGNFDYVSVISELIIKLIKEDVNGVYNVGTEVKTMYDLAKTTNKDVEPVEKLVDESTPTDLTMSLRKLRKII